MKRLLILITLIMFAVVSYGSDTRAIDYSGMIVNDIGRPAADATITIQNLADPLKTWNAVTDTTGTFSFTMTGVSEGVSIPFKLNGNFPNPFNPQTRISYSIDKAADVTISIFNVLGQKVRNLDQGYREPGYYMAVWDGKDSAGRVSSAGVYLYTLDAGGRYLASKMLMVDASTGSWISAKNVPLGDFTENDEHLYLVTVTHPDAYPLSLGPMTLNATTDTLLVIDRFMDNMKLVSKNTYIRGTKWYPYTRPLHKVRITHDYLVNKYEVTAIQYASVLTHAIRRGAVVVDSIFVKSIEGDSQILVKLDTPEDPKNICIKYEDGIFMPKNGCDRYPMTYVSWYGAMFYCYERNIMEGLPQAVDIDTWTMDYNSTGYRLPTDAEWELAAAWTDQREYAFGRDPGYYKPMNTQLNDDGFDDILSPVGWFSPQGDTHDSISDMSGNVYEWVYDWMHYYDPSWEDMVLVDPSGPAEGYNKTARGGSAYGCFRAARTADKANLQIIRTSLDVGFRAVRTVKD